MNGWRLWFAASGLLLVVLTAGIAAAANDHSRCCSGSNETNSVYLPLVFGQSGADSTPTPTNTATVTL
ncbi:MAG: hypothetical protein KDH90_22125, partial [Anaerolineae bacterium]|nr:hypothetical protein [Anaerolineae bacterium]